MSEAVRVAALCDHALVGQDGKVTLVGIFRTINVSALPAEHPRMYLVTVLSLESGQHNVTVRLRLPDGTPAMPSAPELAVAAATGQDVNVVVEFNKLQFGVFGEHRFDVEVDGQVIATLPITIVQMPQQVRRNN